MTGTLVHLATIISAHGLKGECKLKTFTEDPKSVTAYGALTDRAGKRTFSLTITGGHKDALIARIEGITDRNQAEVLKGTELYSDSAAFPKLTDTEYWQHELIGLTVVDDKGETVGTVRTLLNHGAGDILEIEFTGGQREYLPFNDAVFPEVDTQARTIRFNPPEYM